MKNGDAESRFNDLTRISSSSADDALNWLPFLDYLYRAFISQQLMTVRMTQGSSFITTPSTQKFSW